MRRSREQEPIMNVYPPPGEPAVRTDESDFIPWIDLRLQRLQLCAALELLPYDGENALDFARARAGLVPPDAFGALSYSFVLETRGEAALSFAPSVDDGQPLTDYTFSLALLRLR